MELTMRPRTSEPLRILSLDGGGIRGISSLLILERIMEKIRDVQHLDHVPRPCEHFDLIGGTDTGGIIAIMLGRLGMTVDECIRAYRTVAQRVFIPKQNAIIPVRPNGIFSAQVFEEAIKQTVREFCTDGECVNRRRYGFSTPPCQHSDLPFREQACTKTVVFAITKVNVDAGPTPFRTYDKSTSLNGCTIWEVARATSAATTFFKPIKLGRDGIEYIDAGFGYNNPCDKLITEARNAFPGRDNLQILSIGTGLGNVVEITNTRPSIIDALQKMATSSNKVAASLDDEYGDSGHYFRFNVERGLENISSSDWDQDSTISAHTNNYLSQKSRAIDKFVKTFTATDQPKVHQIIPFIANPGFTGREIVLAKLQQKLFLQRTARKVALYGLGGIGKTQVALQLAYWVKNNLPQYSIFWVPAFSEASFKQACTGIVKDLGLQQVKEDENEMELVCQYLSSKEAGPWLFVVDNADDFDLVFGSDSAPGQLCKYFPASNTGVLLLTTRFSRVAHGFTPPRDTIQLSQMEEGEAINFFEKLVAKDLVHDRKMTGKLLEELRWLPLAIKQAAFYINFTDVSISRYLDLMHGTDKDREILINWHFPDDTRYPQLQNAIAKTWRISFEKINRSDPIAAEILQFMSCIGPRGIPRSLLSSYGSEAQTESAISTLCGYAFVTKTKDGTTLDIHALVQLAMLLWVDQKGEAFETIKTVMQRMVKTFPPGGQINEQMRRAYISHALELLRKTEGRDMDERHELVSKVASCLTDDGRTRETVGLLDEQVKGDQIRYNKGHPSGPRTQLSLSGTHTADGQTKKAVELSEYIATMKERTLQKAHHERVVSQYALAMAYRADG
ncbi:hypothetical protein N7471_009222 [Penicillium samsonianum]|uniref:uncharacterized protein n=1 Tax=Penicillium samsonianum TaxID=1882272 RepID=UPI002547D6C5|nr:uncharacterized protein N7471_009222 [Penicillium samsonianum]KAJ6128005.1 hypothetical protein N7471_009222 [Penicillium samsonianum]